MSEHWYTRQGKTAYTTNGRDTTLRDARKLGLVPSVTTVLSVIAKPALETWKVNQGIMAALTGTRKAGEADAAYIARIQQESRQQALDAANEGTRIHDACETYVRDGTCRDEYLLHAKAAKAELHKLFPDVHDWVVEKSFAHPLGFGGKCDLHSPSTGIIVDYKTKDGDFSDGKKLAWDQHWQLAAYQEGLGIRPPHCQLTECVSKIFAPCSAIFISRTHPGAVSSYTWGSEEVAVGWHIFEAATHLWRLTKGFDPSW